MGTLTVRNIPEDAKLRFRQVAAAQGRSMEEHLRQLVIEAGSEEPAGDRVREARQEFKSAPIPTQTREDRVRELIRLADGEGAVDTGRFSEIRFMTAKDAMAELRRLANGAELDLPPRLSTRLEAPEF